MAENVPADKGSKEAPLTALAAGFELDDKIRGLFLGGPMEKLADLHHYFTDEKEVVASWQQKRLWRGQNRGFR